MSGFWYPWRRVRNKDRFVRDLWAFFAQGSFRFGAFSAFRIENGGYIHSLDGRTGGRGRRNDRPTAAAAPFQFRNCLPRPPARHAQLQCRRGERVGPPPHAVPSEFRLLVSHICIAEEIYRNYHARLCRYLCSGARYQLVASLSILFILLLIARDAVIIYSIDFRFLY